MDDWNVSEELSGAWDELVEVIIKESKIAKFIYQMAEACLKLLHKILTKTEEK